MHHKYVVRDGAAIWTGSANWTVDSWTKQENVLAILESEGIAGAYRRNFEELWERRDVESSGRIEPDPVDVGGIQVRAWFTPGNGPELSQAIATAFGAARRRIRIASPVITSAPILEHARRARRPRRRRHRRGGRRATDRHRLRAVGADPTVGVEDPAAGGGARSAAVLGQAVDAVGAGKSTTTCTPRSASPTTPSSSARSTSRGRASRTPRTCSSCAIQVGRRPDGGVRRPGPRALPGDLGASAGDRDDLGGVVAERRDLEVLG